MYRKNFLTVSIITVLLINVQLFAQQPVSIIDKLEIPFLSDPQLSPDGEYVVYVLAQTNWKENKMISHIWRINVDGTKRFQLTYGKQNDISPRWSPDGQYIAFLSKRGDNKEDQIYLIRNEGGEAYQLTYHETTVSSIHWSKDGSLIYFLADDPKTDEEKDKDELKDDVFAYEENYKQKHLWRISVDDSKEQRLTEGNFSILYYSFNKGNENIIVQLAPTPLFDDSAQGEVWLLKSSGSDSVQLTDNNVPEFGAKLSKNSEVIFLAGCNEEFDFYYNSNLFLIHEPGTAPELILDDLPYEITSAEWSINGDEIMFLANTGVSNHLFIYKEKNKQLKQITNGQYTLNNWTYYPEQRKHIFTKNDAVNPGDVWIIDEKEGYKQNRITKEFEYLQDSFKLPRQEVIHWKGEDDINVEGILIFPIDFEQGKPFPLVVITHGGPAASAKVGISRGGYEPVLAGKGYGIFKPNYRGSTGYDDHFLRDMVGHYYNQSHKDVITGVDYLIELGLADSSKLVKMGWSAGGHMTNKIITYTNRFKAASSGAGAVNWISMYGNSDVRIYRTPWFGGSPWQKNAPIDVYWDNSPLKDIHKVNTPTLIFVGEKDVRVPPSQSVELYQALKSNNIPTHLYIAPREPHGWKELNHRLFKVNTELKWFEKYVMNREYIWEKAPEQSLESHEGE